MRWLTVRPANGECTMSFLRCCFHCKTILISLSMFWCEDFSHFRGKAEPNQDKNTESSSHFFAQLSMLWQTTPICYRRTSRSRRKFSDHHARSIKWLKTQTWKKKSCNYHANPSSGTSYRADAYIRVRNIISDLSRYHTMVWQHGLGLWEMWMCIVWRQDVVNFFALWDSCLSCERLCY